MTNINNTIDTIINLLDEQKTLLAPSQREVIMAATHYVFESDGSVALAGPLGSLWVFKDGSVHPVGTPDSSHGYPGYSDPAHLRVAKSDALGNLGLVTIVEKFGRQAELHCEEVGNGTDYPDYRDVFYFPKEDETYNSGYRSGGTWIDSWWS